MARWICPFCNATMTVKPELVGHTKPCAKCGLESQVIDSEQVIPRQTRKAHVPQANDDEDNVSRSAMSVFAIAITVLIVLTGLATAFATPRDAVYCGMAVVGLWIQFLLARPFYVQANDTRQNRRLLEHILRELASRDK